MVDFRLRLFGSHLRYADECHHHFGDLHRTGHCAKSCHGDTDSDVSCKHREICFGDNHGYHASDFSSGESYHRVRTDFAIFQFHGNTAKRHPESRRDVGRFLVRLPGATWWTLMNVNSTSVTYTAPPQRQRPADGDINSDFGGECREVYVSGEDHRRQYCSGVPPPRPCSGFRTNQIHRNATGIRHTQNQA